MSKKIKITVKKFKESDLMKIASFESDELAISMFLAARVGKEPWGKIKTEINSIASEADRIINSLPQDKNIKTKLKNLVEAVRKHLFTFEIPGGTKGLATFAREGRADIFLLPFEIEREIKIKRVFHLKHIVETLSRHNLYAVLLVDRNEGRILVIDKGEIADQSPLAKSFVPEKVKSARETRKKTTDYLARSFGTGTKRIDRYTREQVLKHLDKMTKLLFSRFWRKYKFSHLMIGSREELKSMLEEKIHPYLRQNIQTFWALDPSDNLDGKRKKAERYFKDLQKKRDEEIIGRLAEQIGHPREAVSGVGETLSQLNQNRLYTIYLSSNLESTGYYTKDGYQLASHPHRKYFTSGEKIFTLDLADAVVRKAVLNGTNIRFIESNKKFDKIGGLAGLLKNY